MALNKKVEESSQYFCNDCGKTLGERAFYATSNPKYKASNGKLPFCKVCIKKSFELSYKETHNIKHSIIATSMRYDIPFDDRNVPSFTEGDDTTVEEAISVFYVFQKLTSGANKVLLAKDSFDYEGWVGKLLVKEESNKLDSDEKLFLSSASDGVTIGQDEIAFFGEGYTRKEYQYLVKSFLALVQSFDCPNSSMESVFKDLAFMDMRIETAKRSGVSETEIIKLINARRLLFRDGNIELNEKTGDDNIEGLGMQIKRMEQTRPASDPLPEWENSKLNQIATIIAGHILSGEGINNEVTKDYEKILEPHSINAEEILSGSVSDE